MHGKLKAGWPRPLHGHGDLNSAGVNEESDSLRDLNPEEGERRSITAKSGGVFFLIYFTDEYCWNVRNCINVFCCCWSCIQEIERGKGDTIHGMEELTPQP